ncbi:MAG: tetratricopeptide repeat protein, partial [Planctomycetota bacterium]
LLLGQQMSFQALEERRREAAAALAAQSAAAAEAAAEAAAGAGAAEPGESDRPSPAERRIERQDRLTANAARESIYSSLRGKTEQQIAADPYLSLLRDLEQGIRTGAPAAAGSPERSGLEDMTPEAIRAAREARREAQRERLGDEQVTDAQLDAQSSGAGSGEVARLLRELDYDRPALSSLAPVESGLAVDEYVRRGEARMKAGNFLQAESTFREALLEEPDHVLAKAGLAHARLGAGMVRSAAGTLRQLFAAHPEVIALRYEPGLLPPPDRMRWLQRELTRMIERETAVAEAGLLLAYLGYQTGWPNVVQVGLDTSESAAVGDPLLPVVRRIWLAPENEAE